ncbi:MAG TPA: hypothetical protein VF510_06545 [Ktedonobacterales bacterium]
MAIRSAAAWRAGGHQPRIQWTPWTYWLSPLLDLPATSDKDTLLRTIEEQVHTLFAPRPPCAAPQSQQSEQAYQA